MDAMPFMWARWLCQCAQTGAAVLLAGTATLSLLAWRTSAERSPIWNRLGWTSWSGLFVAGTLQLGLTAVEMSGLPLAQACSCQVLGNVLGSTVFGAVWKARMCVLATTLVVGWRIGATQQDSGRMRLSAALKIAGVLLAAALLGTLIWSGHARASDKHAWLLPADLIHVVAAGAWPGGLLPLALLLTRAQGDPELVPSAVTITRRFSRLSMVAVGVLAFSGLMNGCGLIRTTSMLWTSTYGRLLLCKVAFFAATVVLGSVNRRLVGKTAAGDSAATLRRLWRNVAWECVLAAGVLSATEALAMSAPPAEM